MKQVLIKPLWDAGLNNRIFETCYPWSFQIWRERAAALGIALDGWDTMPMDKADCVWLLDLPERKRELIAARQAARPGVPFVLQIMETPLARPLQFIPGNQTRCDFILTYEQNSELTANRFSYRLPYSFGGFHDSFTSFNNRQTAVMVNANKYVGFLAVRATGYVGLPGIGHNLGGWKTHLSSWVDPAHGELVSWRRSLARTAEKLGKDYLDVIGSGWSGERISWCPLIPHKRFTNCVAPYVADKLKVISKYRFCIAVENYRGKCDYISEKIFDPMIAGSVPVYLGDENISNVVPSNAFVDVRHFKNQTDLLHYLNSCPESEWIKMIEAGRLFLKSETAKSFSTETFVDHMNRILFHVLGLAVQKS